MTVYFASNEDIDFILSNTTIVTTVGSFNSSYARCGINSNGSGTITAVWGTQLPTTYISWSNRFSFNNSSSADNPVFYLSDGGVDVFKIQPSNGVWKCYTNDGGWVLRATFAYAPPNSVLTRFTVKHDLSVTGSFEVWLGSISVASWSGDTIGTTGATGCTKARFLTPYNTGSDCVYSEVVVSDEHTINMHVATLTPNADGTNTAWTNDYTTIDEITQSTGDVLQSDTAGQVETMGLSNYNGNVDLIVLGVFVSAKAIRAAGGPQKLQLAVREGTTEAFSGDKALTEVYIVYRNQFDINPDTGLAWTIAELDTLEGGVKSIA